MNKLDMATQILLKLIETDERGYDPEGIAGYAWEIADAMKSEADKREQSEAKEKREKVRALLNDENTFLEREGQHFDDVLQPEVDWRLAPSWASKFTFMNDRADWVSSDNSVWVEAPSFGFTGSHIVERPQ